MMIRRDNDSNFVFSFNSWDTCKAFGSVMAAADSAFELRHGHPNIAMLMAVNLSKYYNVRLDRPAKEYSLIVRTTATDYWLAKFREGLVYNSVVVLEMTRLVYSEASRMMFDLMINEQRHVFERSFGILPALRSVHMARNKFREACLPFLVSGGCAGGAKFGEAVQRRFSKRLATVLHGASHYLTAVDDLLEDVDRLRRAKPIAV